MEVRFNALGVEFCADVFYVAPTPHSMTGPGVEEEVLINSLFVGNDDARWALGSSVGIKVEYATLVAARNKAREIHDEVLEDRGESVLY